MGFSIEITRSALKDLKKIDKTQQRKIRQKIDELSLNPTPHGCKQLKGSAFNLFRIRIGDYRVIYSVENQKLLVLIIKIGHRKDIYRE
jgi:mRNA interferase RelE/StbE